MSRWNALPEELDPQIREFADRLRELVGRSGLTPDALAARTGCGTASWEQYLDGRQLPPREAVVALAEVTGVPPHHLASVWEQAERAWNRAETGHGGTTDTLRIRRIPGALEHHGAAGPGAFAAGPPGGPATASPATMSPGHDVPRQRGAETEARPPQPDAPSTSYPPHPDASWAPQAPETYAPHTSHAPEPDASWPPHSPQPHAPRTPHSPQPHAPGASPSPQPDASRTARQATGGAHPGVRRRGPMLAVGAVGALIVVVGAVLLAPGGDDAATAAPPPTAAPTTAAPELPVGVECSGADCAGQDPEAMGCGGEFARTVATGTVGGGRIEVRYSKVCSAAWARLTGAAVGDTVRITAGEGAQDGEVMGATEAYTPMVAVSKPSDAEGCATLTSGTKGCAEPAG
ncbi:XRE family transcriptional regulator [Streptomyces griseus]|uniref:helix-turn-helix domain-containing protein n=1 Tax=Streptomyces griseus TaxID=1911 RepID=UPI0004CC49F9|nr:XRE family transcriptional regulator [Streptomyces griseus]